MVRSVVCNCGKRLKVPDSMASTTGKKVRCPSCHQVFTLSATSDAGHESDEEDGLIDRMSSLLDEQLPAAAPPPLAAWHTSCLNCGAIILESASVCSNCGTPTPREQSSIQSNQAWGQRVRLTDSRLRWVAWGLSIHYAGMTLFLLALWALWIAVGMTAASNIPGLGLSPVMAIPVFLVCQSLLVASALCEIPSVLLTAFAPDKLAQFYLAISMLFRLAVPGYTAWALAPLPSGLWCCSWCSPGVAG